MNIHNLIVLLAKIIILLGVVITLTVIFQAHGFESELPAIKKGIHAVEKNLKPFIEECKNIEAKLYYENETMYVAINQECPYNDGNITGTIAKVILIDYRGFTFERRLGLL